MVNQIVRAFARSATFKRLFAGAVLLGGIGVASSASAGPFLIDRFSINRNTQIDWFVDNFDDGNPPPNTPAQCPFPTCSNATYFTRGTLGPENVGNSGNLVLDRSGGFFNLGLLGNAPGLSQWARLQTNTDSGNTIAGLKKNMTFTVLSRYELIAPGLGESYGIRLEDRDQLDPSDIVDLSVRTNDSGTPIIQFRLTDPNPLGGGTRFAFEVPLELGHDRIGLQLDHPITDSDLIYGRYRYVDVGSPVGAWNSFPSPFAIFHGETWTRATFIANHPLPEPPAPALLALCLIALGFSRRKRAS